MIKDLQVGFQLEAGKELARIITERMDDLEGLMTTSDLLDFLAIAGLSLMISPVSPVRDGITLASEAYFASLGHI